MKNNTQVETAQKSQATKNIQPENVQKDLAKIQSIKEAKKNDKTPVGKVTLMKETEARKKAREEQYRNFRINALKRRCKRLGYTEEETKKFVEKLIEQLNAPNEYTIIVMLNNTEINLMAEAIANAKIKYTHKSAFGKKPTGGYFAFSGNKQLLDKLREIAPPSAKFHIYAKKAESVLPKQDKEVIKKPSNNTAEAKRNAKAVRKATNIRRGNHKKGKGKSVAKTQHRISLSELKKKRKATTVQLKAKKSSKGSKKASTNVKKAA